MAVRDAVFLAILAAALNLHADPPISVPYTMPADGDVTLGLYDKTGHLLRWIVQDDYRRAGANTVSWNGLDQWGQPVPAGDYDLKAAWHAPLTLDYRLTLDNPGTPPWPTGDNKGDWLSDEANPQAAATDGKWVYLAAPGCEKGDAIIAVDENGRRQWGVSENINPRSTAITLKGEYLYILYSGDELTDGKLTGRADLLCLDKKTGQPAKFSLQDPVLKISAWSDRDDHSWLWDLRNKKSFSPFNYGGQPRYFDSDIGVTTNALSLAVAAGKIYVSLAYENRLLVLNAETGKPIGDSIPINSPAGLCTLDDHTLLAVSGTKIVKIDLATKKITPFISTNLAAPDSIALDHAGQIYISDWGFSFQVKVFSADGKFLHAIGKPGGRPWVGKWESDGMLVPRGLAVTDTGKVWVTEDDGSPKRISVWDAASGSFVRDYIGPAPYGGGTYFWADPRDSSEIHANGTRFHIDYTKRTWTPKAIDYRRASFDDAFALNGCSLDGRQVRILHHAGHDFEVVPASFNRLTILEKHGDTYHAVAALGSFPYDANRTLTPDSDSIFAGDFNMWRPFPHYDPPFFAGHMENNYTWSDANGDGRVQPSEMHWISAPAAANFAPGAQAPWSSNWQTDIGPDFTAYFPERFADHLVIMRLAARGWSPSGAPIYDPADAKPLVVLSKNQDIFALHVTNDGKLIVSYNYESHSADAPDAMECFDLANGRALWSFAMPAKPDATTVHANCIVYDYDVPGIGDVVCCWAYHGSFKPYFFTTDGLFIGTTQDDTTLGPTATWTECTRFFYQATDGTRYFVNGANDAEHILQLKGLEKAGRFAGTFTLTVDAAQSAAAWRQLPPVKVAPQPILRVTWLSTAPKIDGDLSDWNMEEGANLEGRAQRRAEVALGHDDTSFYLAYRIHEPTKPLQNKGADWRHLFITGDCVDLMLATDPKADAHRSDAAPGDERLLLSVFQNKPIAVLYRGGSEKVARLDSAQVAVKRDEAGKSYTIEAAIPLRDLNLDPRQTEALRGDVGAIFADETGHNRAERLYYYNKHTAQIADLPTESRFQPDQWGEIDLPLGPNLVHNGSFESQLVDSEARETSGWFGDTHVNGSTAAITTESPHSGQHALLLETATPQTVDPASYKDPDYDSHFIRQFNHGAGLAHAEITQKIPVIPGHHYHLRYFYRGEDFQEERKDTGKPRGYISFAGRIEWQATPQPRDWMIGIGETKVAPDSWQNMTDYQHGWDLPRPYVAPPGATSVTIRFELVTAAEGHHPRAFVDDVEFVDLDRAASH